MRAWLVQQPFSGATSTQHRLLRRHFRALAQASRDPRDELMGSASSTDRARCYLAILTATLAPTGRREPGLRLWETTRPFLPFACTRLTVPRRQLRALSAVFAARIVSPLSFGTTHASKAESVRIAV